MIYKFKWKRHFYWHHRHVAGHRYEIDQDKMLLYYQNGSIEEIQHWKNCAVKLDIDWVLAMKEDMKKQAGKEI